MSEEAMRKHYERIPKETLINILISSREQVEELQKRNKERKQETERLNNIINDLLDRQNEELKYTIPIVEHNRTIIKHLREIERLNNIINELERYINEEYIYDELGMKIFDASKLQDKLQELKGSDK